MADERDPWLSELLDAAAAEYAADDERMQALVVARIAGQRDAEAAATASSRDSHRLRRRARHRGGLGLLGRLGLAGVPAGVALAAIGTATALAVGATATIAVTSQHHHKESVSVSSSGPTPGGSAPEQPGSSAPSASPAATGRSTHPAAPSASAQATDTASSALLHATTSINSSSNVYWAQLDLHVTVKQPVTALDVRVRVSNCTGLAATGSWDSGSPGQFTETTATNSDGSITYEFRLAPGHQVSPGTVAFAVQFNHAVTGWNAADDTYYVSAGTAASTSAGSASGAY